MAGGTAPLAPLPGFPSIPTGGVVVPLPPMPAPGNVAMPGAVERGAEGGKSLPKFVKPKANRARRDLVIFVLLFVLLAAGGGGAFLYFTRAPEPPPIVLNPRPKPVPKETPSTPPTVPEAVKPEDSAPVKPPVEVAVVPPVATPGVQPAPSVPVVVDAAPVETAPVVAPVVAPTIPAPAPVRPSPSVRFVRYADALKVSGVFQGTPPRALVDGRLVRAGEVIDPVLGVRFAGVDAETKHLILEDETTARVLVKY